MVSCRLISTHRGYSCHDFLKRSGEWGPVLFYPQVKWNKLVGKIDCCSYLVIINFLDIFVGQWVMWLNRKELVEWTLLPISSVHIVSFILLWYLSLSLFQCYFFYSFYFTCYTLMIWKCFDWKMNADVFQQLNEIMWKPLIILIARPTGIQMIKVKVKLSRCRRCCKRLSRDRRRTKMGDVYCHAEEDVEVNNNSDDGIACSLLSTEGAVGPSMIFW